MKARLLPTGLYSLTGSTGVDCELQAYAAGLDPLISAVKELQRESFLATAEGYGLETFEHLCRLTSVPSDLTETRKQLAAICAEGADDCSESAILSLMQALGFTMTITADSGKKRVACTITEKPAGSTSEILRRLNSVFPAHLTDTFLFLT